MAMIMIWIIVDGCVNDVNNDNENNNDHDYDSCHVTAIMIIIALIILFFIVFIGNNLHYYFFKSIAFMLLSPYSVTNIISM